MSFRDNLQHLRASRGMTQEQLAMLLGVSRQSVTKWEAEKSYPELDKLLKLCRIFDCTLDDLVQGDLTSRLPESEVAPPDAPPTDACGYDEHRRMMARKVPAGVAAILLGIALALLFEGSVELSSFRGRDGLFILIVLSGVLAGLVFLIPAGMEHAAFQRAHPHVEDFYTEDDRLRARKALSRGLILGIALIFVGVGCLIMLEGTAENIALFLLVFFIALGTWSIVHYGMLLGGTDVAEYNRSVAEGLEIEEIADAKLDEDRREALLAARRTDRKISAICAAIMILATVIGLALLFAPVIAMSDPDGFNPLGTSAAWFWVAWPVGGMLCGVVTLLMRAFAKDR